MKELLKYYHDEQICPFEKGTNAELWWNGEKVLFEHCARDGGFFNRIISTLNEAIEGGGCSGALVDDTIPIEKRAIIFYLDLWHGKNFPYDDLDLIYTY